MLMKGAAVMAASSVSPAPAAAAEKRAAGTLAADEAHWRTIARDFNVTDEFVNLENGNWGIMARPVLEKYLAHTRMVNYENSYFSRRKYADRYREALARIAAALGAQTDEIALTRGATEALQGLIGGYRGLKAGDAVMYADLDYGSIQAAFDHLAARDGCAVVRLAIPEPADKEGLVAFYRDALAANPAVKLVLLTHVSHRTGLVIPVREIAAEARAAGADVIVDAAHSWGQLDFSIDDLGADFVGVNLHKWIGAPLGVGAMYIRRDRLDMIAPNMSAGTWAQDRIFGRVHTGTSNFAAVLTVPDALDYHDAVGRANKEARLRYLRNLWVAEARPLDRIDILTPDDPALHAGITAFRLKDAVSADDNKAIAEKLLQEHGVFTVHRTGVARGACVRATPSIYNSGDDCLRLGEALKTL